MLSDKDKGLVSYLQKNHDVKGEPDDIAKRLYKGYVDIVYAVAPRLAPDKPKIYANVDNIGGTHYVRAEHRGRVPKVNKA